MARRGPPADARARKQRRADGMRRLRARRRNNIEQYLIEISAREKALATKFAGLQEGATDKAEIAIRDFRKYKQSDEAHDRELAVREEIESEISRLADKSDELEKLAGVHEEAESARELRSSERRVRDIYFSIADIDIRKKLIALHREESRLYIKLSTQDVAVAKASSNADDLRHAESSLADDLEKPMLFSRSEEITGNPS